MTVSNDNTRIDKNLSGDGNVNDQHSINYDQVKQWLDQANPNVAHEASQAHYDLGEVLNSHANVLFEQCTRLTQYWDGESSTHAQKAFQRLNATATHLSSKSYEVGNTMKWAGDDAKTAKENFFGTGMAKDGWGVPGLSSLDNDSERARQYLTEHHQNINSDVQTLPNAVGENIAVLNPHGGDDPGPGPGGSPPPGGVPSPGGGPGDPNLPGGPGDPNLPGGPGDPNLPGGPGDPNLPGGPGDPNLPGGPGSGDWNDDPWAGADPGDSSLAGFDPAGVGGLGGGPGSGLGPGGPGSGLGGGPGSGLGGAGMSGGTSGGGLPGGGMAGASGAGGVRGVPMMPHGAGGAGGGNKGQDRERSTWLTEDEDVWTDGKDLPPPVIGG